MFRWGGYIYFTLCAQYNTFWFYINVFDEEIKCFCLFSMILNHVVFVEFLFFKHDWVRVRRQEWDNSNFRIQRIKIAPDGWRLATKCKIPVYFTRDLVSRCDGRGLRQFNMVPVTNSWLSDGPLFNEWPWFHLFCSYQI